MFTHDGAGLHFCVRLCRQSGLWAVLSLRCEMQMVESVNTDLWFQRGAPLFSAFLETLFSFPLFFLVVLQIKLGSLYMYNSVLITELHPAQGKQL